MQVKSLTEKAFSTIRDAIITGVLEPGEILNERGLVERFGLSKTPVRESLQVLQKEGLVRSIPRAGYMVTHITQRELQDWFQARLILESAAVELAARHGRAADLQQLSELANTGYTHGDIPSYQAFLKANTHFHYRATLASGNAALAQLVLQVLEKLERAFHLELDLCDSASEMVHTHRQLVEALQAGDAGLAREIVQQEILSSQKRTTEALSSTGVIVYTIKDNHE